MSWLALSVAVASVLLVGAQAQVPVLLNGTTAATQTSNGQLITISVSGQGLKLAAITDLHRSGCARQGAMWLWLDTVIRSADERPAGRAAMHHIHIIRCKRLQGWSGSCEATGASCLTCQCLTDIFLLLHGCAGVNKTLTTTAGDVIALYAASSSNPLLNPPYKYKALSYTTTGTTVSASVT